jgi:hypothetical protein
MVTKPNVQQLNQYIYDPKSLRYRNISSGKFVSAKQVRAAADTVIDSETQRIRAISQQLVDGQINLAEWQIQSSALLKNLHVSIGIAANGGLEATSASDMGYIASRIKKQYKYLRDFALQIKKGQQKLDGTLVSRSALYVQAGRGTYEDVRRRAADESGLQEEKRVLGFADHCIDCLEQSSLGWQPLDTLASIGESRCRSNCRCYFIYR